MDARTVCGGYWRSDSICGCMAETSASRWRGSIPAALSLPSRPASRLAGSASGVASASVTGTSAASLISPILVCEAIGGVRVASRGGSYRLRMITRASTA
jgi:hypothetical protein